MNELSLLDTKWAQLYYDPDTGIIHHHLTPEIESHHWQPLLSAGYKTLKEKGATKWLSDNRAMVNPIKDEDNAWIYGTWLPETMAAGWRYWAIIVPDEIAAREMMVDFINEFFAKGLRIMVFSQLEAGMAWLEAVDK